MFLAGNFSVLFSLSIAAHSTKLGAQAVKEEKRKEEGRKKFPDNKHYTTLLSRNHGCLSGGNQGIGERPSETKVDANVYVSKSQQLQQLGSKRTSTQLMVVVSPVV